MQRPLMLGCQQLAQAAVEGDEFAFSLDGKRQQVSVRHLPVTNQTTGTLPRDLRDLHVVRKKL